MSSSSCLGRLGPESSRLYLAWPTQRLAGASPTMHFYPRDLAAALQQRWPAEAEALPTPEVLTEFISALYQASQLFEEGQPVECHVVLATQPQLEAQPVTLADFHLVRFAEPRAWNEQELRRLSPAVQHANSLLTVE